MMSQEDTVISEGKNPQSFLTLFGLLYISEAESTDVNVRLKRPSDRFRLYLMNALGLAASLKRRGVRFVLLTNCADLVNDHLSTSDLALEVEQIPFLTKVPSGVRFYAAHFKIDAFKFLATVTESYVGLCDLDMVCNADIPQCFRNIITDRIPAFYDISDQVIPAYGHNAIIHDLEKLQCRSSEGRWAGGEFVAGPPGFFATLCEVIKPLVAPYFALLPGLHHVGDEMLTSAALEIMRRGGVRMVDVGTLGVVARYWSIYTRHAQRPIKAHSAAFLLHLPSDKHFLAAFAHCWSSDGKGFLRSYRLHQLYSLRAVRRCVLMLLGGFGGRSPVSHEK